jgi:hypothetical protein
MANVALLSGQDYDDPLMGATLRRPPTLRLTVIAKAVVPSRRRFHGRCIVMTPNALAAPGHC